MTQARTLPAKVLHWLVLLALIWSAVPASFQTALAAPAAAPTNVVRLRVFDATAPATTITTYQYLINEDNTGNTRDADADCRPTDPGLTDPTLANCDWPSIHKMPGNAPIVTQGDQADFAAGLDLTPYLTLHPNATKFLISVVADGYKIGGQHFSLPLDDANNLVEVELEPNPLPTLTFRAMVFNDNTSPNGAMDTPGENGLNGFEGHLADVLGEISTDWFGNPLCTEYERDGNGDIILDVDGAPTPIPGTGGICLSGDRNHDGVLSAAENDPAQNPDYGQIVIPNLGSNKFAASVVPPDGSDWVQTTTLEGGHDWDTWLMEGATGYDTEFLYQNELFPWAFFGFVRPMFRQVDAGSTSLPGNDTYPGELRGTVWGMNIYVPPSGGLPLGSSGGHLAGAMGAKKDYAVDRPYIALADLNAGDQMVYMGRGNPDGTFHIRNVPPGDYLLTVWDGPQNLLLFIQQIAVLPGDTTVYPGGIWPADNPGDPDVPGNIGLAGWFTRLEGSVFIDTNVNGRRDPGEQGLPQQLVALKMRGNSLVQHGSTGVTTGPDGSYEIKRAYPFNSWIVMEVYNDLYYTTGITYQADNQLAETTVMGQGVDVNVLPVIGLSGRLDWGVLPYKRTENGGIVGSISYDVTRNELDPRLAAAEDWQPGVPNINVNLYLAIPCGTHVGTACDASGKYEVDANGALARSPLLQTYLSESWERPTGCTALDVNGNPVVQQALSSDPNAECVDVAPMLGVQFGPMPDDPLAPTNFGATVDGNFGFGDGCFIDVANKIPGQLDPATGTCLSGTLAGLPAGDYLVEVSIPNDPWGRPLYKVTREEDINVFNGDAYVPQLPPPSCAGALHTVDVAGVGADGLTATVNANFSAEGGSPYEGQQRPLCDVKLVRLQNGRSIAPGFNLFTDVPLPARFNGLLVDNLNLSADPRSVMFGEVAGISNAPIGIYDFNGRLVHTIESDPNGAWEVLMPSSLQINCPTPAGVCPNMFRFVGNDPGQPFHRNPNWNPQYQTISVPFEAWPGVINPADLAPMPIAATLLGGELTPGTQFSALAQCVLPADMPRLFAVSKPYVLASDSAAQRTIAILGDGFGALQGAGSVTLDGIALPITGWSNGVISVTIPTAPVGAQQLMVQTDSGQTIINGLTIHILTALPAFPSTGVLDSFTRANTSNGFGGSWVDDSPNAVFNTFSNQGRIRTGNNIRNAWWNAATYGDSQEAYFTFVQVSPAAGADEQGLLLKYSGGADPNANAAQWVEVTYDRDTAPAAGLQPGVLIRAKLAGSAPATRLTLPLAFANGDQLGARALSDGTIIAYRNGAEIGRVNIAATAAWTGRIGVRFEGTGGTNAAQAVIDNFGGGSLSLGTIYAPSVIEVGPGRAFDPTITTIDPITGLPYEHALQNALEAAAVRGTALVVVYPNTPVPNTNPLGVYFENIVVHSTVKLQGVGPGGIRADGSVVGGSILDGISYSADATPSVDWYALVASLLTPGPAGADPIAIGNPNISDGQVVYVLPSAVDQFGSTFNAAIDGFTIQGGDQAGLPLNVTQPGGGQPTFIGDVPTQGGGIYVHGYARNLQITNNILQSNGGAYGGAIRVGTPSIDNNNHDLRIAHNRFLANGGTNLAGAIGLFQDSDGYEVAYNDFCGNFSAEYGGAISHFGLSHNGQIHDNRIYFNQSVDEGGAIMIGGELPADPNANYGTPNGPQGAGAVDVYNNVIQSNLAGDDGGGLRFLMAGNFPYNIYNNLIVNNLSAHEGGGVALHDAPDVQFYNNTVMKNLTTDTAVTAIFNTPYPAGLSTGANSAQLQATLPGGSPTFSDPLQFNNIFWDNRAGTYNPTTAQVEGLGLWITDTVRYWDMGSGEGSALSPTNSILFGGADLSNVVPSASNDTGVDPLVLATYDTQVSVFPWRSPNRPAPVIIAVENPGVLQGDYHLSIGSSAVDLGAVSKSSVSAPAFDIDNEQRPAGALCLPDSGADELQTGGTCADLSITKTDGVTSVMAGSVVNYTIVVANSGPSAVTGAPVTDTFPAALTVNSWTCTATAGSSCTAGGSGNNRTGTVTLVVGGSATFTAQATLSASANGSLANTATVAAPSGATDLNTANNSATDTDTIAPALPALTLRDSFNRANANTLGSNWSQIVVPFLGAAIRTNSSQAFAALLGWAIWNGPGNVFGTRQAAAFTFASTPGGAAPSTLILKASGGTAASPSNYVGVAYFASSNQVVVASTTNSGGTLTTHDTFPAAFANGDTLSAVVDATGTVYVYKTSGAATTFVGLVTIPGAGFWTGTGRIGLLLPINARVDNFSGGTLP